MKWNVEITETLQRRIEVEAESAEAAEHKARAMYHDGDIVLVSSDLVDAELTVLQ